MLNTFLLFVMWSFGFLCGWFVVFNFNHAEDCDSNDIGYEIDSVVRCTALTDFDIVKSSVISHIPKPEFFHGINSISFICSAGSLCLFYDEVETLQEVVVNIFGFKDLDLMHKKIDCFGHSYCIKLLEKTDVHLLSCVKDLSNGKEVTIKLFL